jgi:peroxiredoxin
MKVQAAFTVAVLGLLAVPLVDRARADDAAPAPREGDKKAEGPKAPDFALRDVDGKERRLSEFADKWVVLEWTNYGCPYVKKHYRSGVMQALQANYGAKGVVWLSICSSAPGKQGHMPPADWKREIAAWKARPTTVLLDESGQVGRLYGAKRTPEVRILGPGRSLVYAGAVDDAPDASSDPRRSGSYVVAVLDAVLAGKPSPFTRVEPYGCTVKYAQ